MRRLWADPRGVPQLEITETLRADPADQGAWQKKKEDGQEIVSAISALSVDIALIHAL